VNELELAMGVKQIRSEVDYSGGIRKGTVDFLPMGELPRYNIPNGSALVSTANGVALQTGWIADITTFIICKRYTRKYNEMYTHKHDIFNTISKDFAKHETKTVMERLAMHADGLILTDAAKVNRLQELFNNLGRPAVVLPDETVIAVSDKAFTLVIRQDIQMHHEDSPMNMTVTFTVWEDVGFIYHLPGAC